MESKPPLTRIFTATDKRACVKLQLELHPCINSRSSEMGKTSTHIIPAGKMCSLQRSNREILCILGKKLPKHQETQTILQQCEPDGTYQPSTIPKPAWFLEPQEPKTLDLLQTEFMRTFSKQHVGGKEHQLIIIYQDLENITFGCIPCGIPSHFSMDLAQFAWEEASPILEG